MPVYEFGSFLFDVNELCLSRGGEILPLARKPLEVLALLVTNHGRLLTKDELIREIWPDTTVEDSNLTVSMSKIRKVLDDQNKPPLYISTLHCRGYRFIGEVRQIVAKTFDSIAVHPFESVPGLPYVADEFQETILYGLSTVPGLRVIKSQRPVSSQAIKVNPRQVGIEIGVKAILTGRIVIRTNKISVSAELVDVRCNELIWGEHYQAAGSNSMGTLRGIGSQIVEKLKSKVSDLRCSSVEKKPAVHHLYERGRFLWKKRSEMDLKKSIELFKSAIKTDPAYALSYAGLANSYNVLGFYALLSPKVAFPRAKAAAAKALAIDSSLAEAHAAQGYAKLYYDWDLRGANQCFRRALNLDPNSATAHQFYGNLLTVTATFDAAIAEFKRALEIEPLSLIVNAALGYCYYFARRYEEAVEQCKSVMELDKYFEPAHIWLGWVYQQKGMWEEALLEYKHVARLSGSQTGILGEMATAYARAGESRKARRILATLKRFAKERYISPYCIACVYAALGELDSTFEWLETAYQNRSHLLLGLGIDPKLDLIRTDQRFMEMVNRVGLKWN